MVLRARAVVPFTRGDDPTPRGTEEAGGEEREHVSKYT